MGTHGAGIARGDLRHAAVKGRPEMSPVRLVEKIKHALPAPALVDADLPHHIEPLLQHPERFQTLEHRLKNRDESAALDRHHQGIPGEGSACPSQDARRDRVHALQQIERVLDSDKSLRCYLLRAQVTSEVCALQIENLLQILLTLHRPCLDHWMP